MCLAVPGRILSIEDTDPIMRNGRIDFSGIIKQISLAFVPEAGVGDYVLVHAGVALSTIDEKEAQEIFSMLREMGDLADLEDAGPT
jgi:hydrogenase expression/formation protein HypC